MKLNTAKLKLPLCLALIVALALPAAANAASMTATPGVPWAGAALRLEASGFKSRTSGVATLSGVRPVTFRVDARGRAKLSIAVPLGLRRGVHALRIQAGDRSVSTRITVVAAKRASARLVALSGGARVLLDPARGAVGDRFTVRATRFPGLASIVVRFDGESVAKKRTNARGALTFVGSVPRVARGTRLVRVASVRTVVNLRFVVLEAGTPPPPPPPPPLAPPDTTKPTVSITTPASGAALSSAGAPLTVNATAADDVGVAGVQFRLDGNPLNTDDTSAPYSTTWNLSTASHGSHTLTAVARDGAGNTATSTPVTVTVADTTPPTVSITAPPPGIVSGKLVVRATAADNTGVASVQFRRGNANLGAADTIAPYSTTWDTTGTGGQTFSAIARDAAGNQTTSSAVAVTVNNTNTRLVAAAGDIACSPNDPSFNLGIGIGSNCRQMATSDLLMAKPYTDILTLGDTQYDCATANDFAGSFDPSWGRKKAIIHPATGNHEYKSLNPDDYGVSECVANAGGYFGYFGGVAGNPAPGQTQGYFSFDAGPYWHIVSLNTNDASAISCTTVSCALGSAQETWLRQDLAASNRPCTLAIWHHPLFASNPNSISGATIPFWNDLQAEGAEIILNGHAHNYERFEPQLVDGTADPNGMAQFIVGTGGVNLENTRPPIANSAARVRALGVLELTLRPNSYDYQFLAIPGQPAFTDNTSSGSVPCH